MNNLWNPSKTDRAALNSFSRKKRIRYLKEDRLIEESDCVFCGKRVYLHKDGGYITMTGSKHKCKGMESKHE